MLKGQTRHLSKGEGWAVYVPQYCGDPTVDNDFINCLPDGALQISQLSLIIRSLRKIYKNIIVLSHSYGCYLGRKLLDNSSVDALITINGVFDLQTLKNLSPTTFRTFEGMMDSCIGDEDRKWIHFHSVGDPVVPLASFYSSLESGDKAPAKIEILNGSEHEITALAVQKMVFEGVQNFLKTDP